MSETPPERNSTLRRLADSPAPWIVAFGAAALIGLLAIAPKHRARQERLERMAHTREGIWYDKPELESSNESSTVSPPNELQPTPPSAENVETAPPSSDEFEQAVSNPPTRHEMPPVAVFVALSLAVLAAGLGLLSYLRSVSRDRRPRPRRDDA
ncbi:MAG TPA: hypothetical protein VGJ26_06775 [Pirellulales bacterium]|jgi:hypothetical protein